MSIYGWLGRCTRYASTFLDDVVLPPFYGRTSEPGLQLPPSPENGATDVFNEDIVFMERSTVC